jgi:hypothetical protein
MVTPARGGDRESLDEVPGGGGLVSRQEKLKRSDAEEKYGCEGLSVKISHHLIWPLDEHLAAEKRVFIVCIQSWFA